jgi:peptidoglycan/xylan/chitin deacetylase (PgdA/CDA1 family)
MPHQEVPVTSPAGFRIALTFDVDAESALVGDALDRGEPGHAALDRVGAVSDLTFGIRRGLPRVLRLLSDLSIPATFYVPGSTIHAHAASIAEILERGHELGHHGHLHRRPAGLSRSEQRQELELGFAAHGLVGSVPQGYRAPGWDVDSTTLELLAEYGFRSDSSMMGDDRPYAVLTDQGSFTELPIHWSLDDWPYFGFRGDAGNLADVAIPFACWSDECDLAREEQRPITLTLHPEVIGRGYRFVALRRFLELQLEAGASFSTHRDLSGSVPDR